MVTCVGATVATGSSDNRSDAAEVEGTAVELPGLDRNWANMSNSWSPPWAAVCVAGWEAIWRLFTSPTSASGSSSVKSIREGIGAPAGTAVPRRFIDDEVPATGGTLDVEVEAIMVMSCRWAALLPATLALFFWYLSNRIKRLFSSSLILSSSLVTSSLATFSMSSTIRFCIDWHVPYSSSRSSQSSRCSSPGFISVSISLSTFMLPWTTSSSFFSLFSCSGLRWMGYISLAPVDGGGACPPRLLLVEAAAVTALAGMAVCRCGGDILRAWGPTAVALAAPGMAMPSTWLLPWELCAEMLLWGVWMGTFGSTVDLGNSTPLLRSSLYTADTPCRSVCPWNASAQLWMRLRTCGENIVVGEYIIRRNVHQYCNGESTFSWTSGGGSFFGPISLTISWTKSLLVTSMWKRLPQFFTQVSSTWREWVRKRKRQNKPSKHKKKRKRERGEWERVLGCHGLIVSQLVLTPRRTSGLSFQCHYLTTTDIQ